jgi:RNA recognition motif-containing protein
MQQIKRTVMINIYVGNLPYSVKSNELRETFEEFGDVESAEVIFDRRTKRSRGYGFVEMANDEAGLRAIEALNGSDYQGRELRVDLSQPKEHKPESRSKGDGSGDGRRRPSGSSSNANTGGLMGFVKKIFS